MIRRIIRIDREKCNGCGACAAACHEGAIEMRDGKAYLAREDYCDGLGDCLPACPAEAITFEEREAPAYDAAAVAASRRTPAEPVAVSAVPPSATAPETAAKGPSCAGTAASGPQNGGQGGHSGGCPGHRLRQMDRSGGVTDGAPGRTVPSQLAQWPCQLRLVPVRAPYFQGARLLVAADCTAYAYARLHEEYMRGRITLIGCPKLDDADYTEKLTAILRENEIAEVTVIRMEVPCCGGLERAVREALQHSGKFLPWQVVTLSVDGRIIS